MLPSGSVCMIADNRRPPTAGMGRGLEIPEVGLGRRCGHFEPHPVRVTLFRLFRLLPPGRREATMKTEGGKMAWHLYRTAFESL